MIGADRSSIGPRGRAGGLPPGCRPEIKLHRADELAVDAPGGHRTTITAVRLLGRRRQARPSGSAGWFPKCLLRGPAPCRKRDACVARSRRSSAHIRRATQCLPSTPAVDSHQPLQPAPGTPFVRLGIQFANSVQTKENARLTAISRSVWQTIRGRSGKLKASVQLAGRRLRGEVFGPTWTTGSNVLQGGQQTISQGDGGHPWERSARFGNPRNLSGAASGHVRWDLY
jgi:hypothetical protein